MMRWRVDFTIRELDVPEDKEARGVSFGDEVDARSLYDFFNRCRDAVIALFGVAPRTTDVVNGRVVNVDMTQAAARDLNAKIKKFREQEKERALARAGYEKAEDNNDIADCGWPRRLR